MKKLSDLVLFKNQLDKLSTVSAKDYANLELSKFTHLVGTRELDEKLNLINQSFIEFDNELSQIKTDLKLAIEEAEKPWFQESYRLHEEKEVSFQSADHVFEIRTSALTEEVKNIIVARLNVYTSWHHAGMFIRPAKSTLVNQMVSFDPLYLVDTAYDLLVPCVQSFNEAYQNRLRKYIIEDVNNTVILEKIPNEQFGLCVAYMFFNYKPIEVIKQYFTEIYQKLKPGGTLAFTFNDGDRVAAVKLVETRFCCYTPGSLIKELAQSIGFEITYTWSEVDGPLTWLELKKPGMLTSLKGGQPLAKIVSK